MTSAMFSANKRGSEPKDSWHSEPIPIAVTFNDVPGDRGWYWHYTEYPEEGAVGPFANRADVIEWLTLNHDGYFEVLA